MVAARLASPALRIPWGDLLKAAPDIFAAAAELVTRLADRRRGPVAFATRLEALETSDVSQANLSKEMANQLKEVTEALRIVALRTLFALGFSLGAFVLGLAAFIRTFL
jgi:hypothetical protein